ncbi:MAG: TIGR00296 family protein [Anaerolineales bacterium]|nr:TIGR00296 family protein [Anaerolineales bacterium]
MFTLAQGTELVRLARRAIIDHPSNHKVMISEEIKHTYGDKSGCFVTLFYGASLRGCIGYPLPDFPLFQAIVNAARSTATNDPRFRPVSSQEMEKITIEINILTVPVKAEVKDYREYLEIIKIGRDGLWLKNGYQSGLLLPHVASERNWDVLTFLEQTCYKAGLPAESWKNPETHIFLFQSQVFKELSPSGDVVEVD